MSYYGPAYTWRTSGGQDFNPADALAALVASTASLESLPGKPEFDAFGRARAATPLTLFDGKLLYDKAPLFFHLRRPRGQRRTDRAGSRSQRRHRRRHPGPGARLLHHPAGRRPARLDQVAGVEHRRDPRHPRPVRDPARGERRHPRMPDLAREHLTCPRCYRTTEQPRLAPWAPFCGPFCRLDYVESCIRWWWSQGRFLGPDPPPPRPPGA